jgi:chromosome segregation ATPase
MNDDTQPLSPTPSDNVRPRPTESDTVRPRPTMSATRTEAHTLTTREVMKMFEAAGIPRAQRSIERYCQQGDLDCLPDAIERRQYITQASVDTLIGQLKELAARHQNANAEQRSPTSDDDRERRGATTAAGESVKHGTPEKHDEKPHAGDNEGRIQELEARLKEVENQNFNLEIDKRARDQIVGILREQMTQQTKEFSGQLTQQSRRVGQLETEMRQLMAPRRDSRPTADDRETVDDGRAIDAEYHETHESAPSNREDISTNAPHP